VWEWWPWDLLYPYISFPVSPLTYLMTRHSYQTKQKWFIQLFQTNPLETFMSGCFPAYIWIDVILFSLWCLHMSEIMNNVLGFWAPKIFVYK
jgi:hypothetical protein